MPRPVALALVALGASGCSGHLVMTNLSPDEIQKPGWTTDGIVVYLPAWFREHYRLTKLTKDGKTIGTAADDTCIVVDTEKLAVHADMSVPRLLAYRHGLLEAYTFAATIGDDGALKSVNTVSTPDQGTTLKNLATAATSFAGLPARAKRQGRQVRHPGATTSRR